jgi:uroporphyrinogen decarboxylase
MMTSKEVVRRTIEYEEPERVAKSYGDSDFCLVENTATTHATDWVEIGNGRWERTDEWGNTWGRVDATSKGEVVKGVLEDISSLDAYEFPDISNPGDYVGVSEHRSKHPDKWLVGSMPGFAFNIARKMRKLDQYLTDLMSAADRMHELHNRIDLMLEDMIRNYALVGVDCVMFPEDWGTQKQTLIDPVMWQTEFFPRFQKLCSIAHNLGIKVFMHSCGKIETIVPGLMDAGIDVLQFDQPDLHGIDTLAGHQKRGKITFWCPVDIQKTLQQRDENVIRAKAREMLNKLWHGRGGFIAGYYEDNASIGLDPMWQNIACDEFTKAESAANFIKDN